MTSTTAADRRNDHVRFPATFNRRSVSSPDTRLLVTENSRQALAAATGITERAILNDLLQAGVNENSLPAFLLLPLLEVAWANGGVSARERRIILRAATSSGITEGSSAYSLLEFWLSARPPQMFTEVWYEVAETLGERLKKLGDSTRVVRAHRGVSSDRVSVSHPWLAHTTHC